MIRAIQTAADADGEGVERSSHAFRKSREKNCRFVCRKSLRTENSARDKTFMPVKSRILRRITLLKKNRPIGQENCARHTLHPKLHNHESRNALMRLWRCFEYSLPVKLQYANRAIDAFRLLGDARHCYH